MSWSPSETRCDVCMEFTVHKYMMLAVYISMGLTLTYKCSASYSSWAPPYAAYLIPSFQVNTVVSPSVRYSNAGLSPWCSNWTQPSLSTTLDLILQININWHSTSYHILQNEQNGKSNWDGVIKYFHVWAVVCIYSCIIMQDWLWPCMASSMSVWALWFCFTDFWRSVYVQ